ncbi:hypothetical protein [Chryseolinea soli]|uniref:DUF1440 domain-containing protein n=1 Tax=Chryseolinea soli TaxID=2321403 RepID=A0A385SPK9_9BACT|nr:hypothetical protein [Chryseolinea soli]AYB32772.1 hypothetical protein D4L85_20290 [Chryseolinea soli]
MENVANARLSDGIVKAIILAGLLAGTMDILSAFIHFYIVAGGSPVIVLHYIASAVFGKEAYAGGAGMALTGLLFHYIIAYGWTVLYFLAFPYLSFLAKNKYVSGVLYGAFVWVCMNKIVVPLTLVKMGPFDVAKAALQMGILMVCIGLPIAILADRFYKRGK